MDFDWNTHSEHVDALRAMGCAVVTITPTDISALTEEGDDDEPTMSDDQVNEWMSLHSDDVEEALLGDYWSETVRDLLSFYPLEPKA